jgi:hypothetical protein
MKIDKDLVKILLVITNTKFLLWMIGSILAALLWSIRVPMIGFIITTIMYLMSGD